MATIHQFVKKPTATRSNPTFEQLKLIAAELRAAREDFEADLDRWDAEDVARIVPAEFRRGE